MHFLDDPHLTPRMRTRPYLHPRMRPYHQSPPRRAVRPAHLVGSRAAHARTPTPTPTGTASHHIKYFGAWALLPRPTR